MDDLVGGEISTRMTRSSHSARNFCGNCPNALAAMASNSSSDGFVAKCPPGGAENGVAAMVLRLTDNPGYIGASPFGGKLIRRSASAENLEGLRRFIWHQYGWFRVGLHPNGQKRR